MCTVTFIARQNGYALGMNRDEHRTRVAARAPARQELGGRTVLFPAEPGGGTWVGVNDVGVTFALVNWYAIPDRVPGKTVSRGAMVRATLPAASAEEAAATLTALPLARVNPFRLLGIFPASRCVIEWRWNLNHLERLDHGWQTNAWFSSGFDEPGAQRSRGKVFADALRQRSAGTLSWLRRLHRAHRPERGPYATCMHRDDAATVSYTEVVITGRSARMCYAPGPPCGTPLLPALRLSNSP